MTPASFEANEKLAPSTVVDDGGAAVIDTVGGVVSGGVYVQATDTGSPDVAGLVGATHRELVLARGESA